MDKICKNCRKLVEHRNSKTKEVDYYFCAAAYVNGNSDEAAKCPRVMPHFKCSNSKFAPK